MQQQPKGFRERLALLVGTPVIRRIESEAPRWTRLRRLRVAMANDNKASWYAVLSKASVADLERKFREGLVGGVLYNTVGGILGDHTVLKHQGGTFYLYMQLRRVDSDVLLCLREAGVREIVGPVRFKDIRYY